MQNQDIRTEDVFTPSAQAQVNFVPRHDLENRLVDALNTPGRQVVVYGHTGSGKSTLINRKLIQTYPEHITTRCQNTTTYESILLDAFDQLEAWYATDIEKIESTSADIGIAAIYNRIRLSLKTVNQEQLHLRRALPPQLTAQRLAQFMGQKELVWLIEDFHKVSIEHKKSLSQTLKIFVDEGNAYRNLHVILVGAVATAREVVEYDHELARRVAEIHVPLMTDIELRQILDQGSKLLNIHISDDVKELIVSFSSGLAGVCHELALNICRASGVARRSNTTVQIGKTEFDAAVKRYAEDSADSIKSAFDKALRRHRVRKYDNCRLVLKAIAGSDSDGMTHAEILAVIRKDYPKYPPGNLTNYLGELAGVSRGRILRFDPDSAKYSFTLPIYRTYAHATLFDRHVAKYFDFAVDSALQESLKILFENLRRSVDTSVEAFEASMGDMPEPGEEQG